MSEPPAPYPPPPPWPASPDAPPPRTPRNGIAVASLVLGIIGLCASPIPLLNFVGGICALIGLVLGTIALLRAGRLGRRGLAAWGTGLSATALVISIVVGFIVLRYLGDLLDFVDPPEPSAKVGERFTTDDGDLSIVVTSITCPDAEPCDFAFEATNKSDRTIYLDNIRVKGVVDGQWRDPWLDGTTSSVDPGESVSRTGTISVSGGRLDGIAFDADDASSHSAVVVAAPGP
ncbi:DUF4190 domain-containing protein [Pimelobacter simplex]|uniref:DUF4190 domain-containing protein n=1 Tax=Nocardioides simplex TaxID=2045 RepID=UPI0037F40E37